MPFVDLRRHTQVVAIDRGTGCGENLGSVRSSQLDGSWGWREVRRSGSGVCCFQPPELLSTPIVMVCAGSAIAPSATTSRTEPSKPKSRGVTPAPAFCAHRDRRRVVGLLRRPRTQGLGVDRAGVIALGLYGFVATLQPDAHFGRVGPFA